MAKQNIALVPVERVERRILQVRGLKVIIDSDLAELYGVTTSRLNEQVKRNKGRFPEDFVFRLHKEEFKNLMSQNAISSSSSPVWGGRRKMPYVFTEHGAIMAAGVLNSERAVQTSIYVVRAFVKLRQMVAANAELAKKLAELENKLQTHDKQILALVDAIRRLMIPPQIQPSGKFGFHSKKDV